MIVRHRDANGLVKQLTDRLDRNLDLTRDTKGNVTKITFPFNGQQCPNQQFEYNSNSQLTKATDELARVTTFTYDAEGNLTQIKQADPDGGGPLSSPINTLTYTADGFVDSIMSR